MRYEPEDYNSDIRVQDRVEWCQKFFDLGGGMMDAVYMDEAGFNLHLTRHFGRAPRGKKAVRVRPTQKGRNVSVAVAVGREGIIGVESRLGAYNGEKFIEFVQNRVLPNLDRSRFILLDNASFQRKTDLQKMVKEAGHTFVRLPPYSPHLHASEWVFGFLKTRVRRQDLKDQENLIGHIENAPGRQGGRLD